MRHELGARLTRIGLLSVLANRPGAKPDEIRSNIARLAQNTREMIQAMDEIVWAVDPTKDTIGNLVDDIAAFVEEFLESSDLRCQLDLPAVAPAGELPAKARHNILLVIKVENQPGK
jgi:signal transduction histidine kinase